MSNVAIRSVNLSKSYLIRSTQVKGRTLQEDLINLFKNVFTRPQAKKNRELVWALREVSFEIQPGEIVGIIGRNGAGKSTLLKVLSQITEPTSGYVDMYGRVGSLLEVGTGFHTELTGRENIYLGGAVLGMTRPEIRKKFDQIVDFSGVERFLDVPVKRYSSGMQVRLAFSVAAHLEPEILLIDEVLAVGDAEFQRKCLGKMDEVASGGRTVLFVSHNMGAVEQLCSRVILLENGGIVADENDPKKITTFYYKKLASSEAIVTEWKQSKKNYSGDILAVLRFYLATQDNINIVGPVRNDLDTWLFIEVDIIDNNPSLSIGYVMYSEDGATVYVSNHTDLDENRRPKLKPGKNLLRTKIPRRFLNEGIYRIELSISLYNQSWLIRPGHNAPFILLSIQGGLSDSPYWVTKRGGIIAPELEWETVE